MESPFENERGQNPKNEKGTPMQARNPQPRHPARRQQQQPGNSQTRRARKPFARGICKSPKRQAHSLPTPFFPNAREQIPHMPHMRISQKVKGILMQNPQHIVFI